MIGVDPCSYIMHTRSGKAQKDNNDEMKSRKVHGTYIVKVLLRCGIQTRE